MACSRFFFRLQSTHNCRALRRRPAAASASHFLAVPSSLPPRYLTLCTTANCHVASAEVAAAEPQQQQLPGNTRSTDLVALEYADLNLSYNLDLGHVRIRQHVNPLSSSFSVPTQVPDWNQVFADPLLPLMVDIGCGSGSSSSVPSYGHFFFANATISFKQLVESYPGPLLLVSVLCPDPHFKKRHHKRRVLQKPLVGAIVDNLMPGGQVFVQSDVLEMAVDMRNQFDEVDSLKHIDALNTDMLCDSEGWLLSNPMGIRTEREIHAELEGAKIYRRLYRKQM